MGRKYRLGVLGISDYLGGVHYAHSSPYDIAEHNMLICLCPKITKQGSDNKLHVWLKGRRLSHIKSTRYGS